MRDTTTSFKKINEHVLFIAKEAVPFFFSWHSLLSSAVKKLRNNGHYAICLGFSSDRWIFMQISAEAHFVSEFINTAVYQILNVNSLWATSVTNPQNLIQKTIIYVLKLCKYALLIIFWMDRYENMKEFTVCLPLNFFISQRS